MDSPAPSNQASPSPFSPPADETPTQKQARLRRERRQAKIAEEGTSRLEKITQVSGRQNLPEPPPVIPSKSTSRSQPSIPSQQSQQQQQQQQQAPINGSGPDGMPTEADIRALLRSSMGTTETNNDDAQSNQQQQEEQDPMVRLMSTLLGTSPSDPNNPDAAGGANGLPPGLASLLGAAIPGMNNGASAASPAQQRAERQYTSLWKVVHAAFALLLGIYVTGTATVYLGYSGVKSIGRPLGGGGSNPITDAHGTTTGHGSGSMIGNEPGINLFLAFATLELVLQSSRLFLESRRKSAAGGGNAAAADLGFASGGWTGMAASVLPEPWRTRVLLVGRYVGILGTVIEDAMVVVFVVGVVAWWRGAVG